LVYELTEIDSEIISDDLLAHVAPLGWEHITFNLQRRLRLAHRAAPK